MAQVLTVPNLLTLLRLAALPVVIALSRTGHPIAGSMVFIAAMLTDAVDGWIAVRFHQQSRVGLYLDPVVDKVVILALLYELSFAALLVSAIPHLFLARELFQNGIRSYAASKGSVIGANWMGKTKAVIQTILIAWGLLLPWVTAGKSEAFVSTMRSAFQLSAWLILALAWVFFFVFLNWNRHLFRSAEPST